MQKLTDFESSEEKVLAYDLRQDYARLVGEHMKDVAEARKRNDFNSWFMALRDLYTLTQFKYITDAIRQTFNSFLTNITKIANENASCWIGKSQNPEQITKIDNALRELEEWIYTQMNDANMFGSKFAEDEGL